MTRSICLAMMLMALPASAADTPDMRGASFAMQGGEAVYRGVCQGCHMADAKGASGAGTYPALAGNPRLAEAGYVRPVVGARFPLERAAEALTLIDERGATGKVVLEVA